MTPGLTMTDSTPTAPTVEFRLGDRGAAKRPEQLVSLLARVLRQEFPDIVDRLEVVSGPETGVVSIAHLDQVDPALAKNIAHRARAVYNEFVTSPWY